MSPVCPICYGLIADERGLIEYQGDLVPSICQCEFPPMPAAEPNHDHNSCAVFAGEAVAVIAYLQEEIKRLEQLLISNVPSGKGNN